MGTFVVYPRRQPDHTGSELSDALEAGDIGRYERSGGIVAAILLIEMRNEEQPLDRALVRGILLRQRLNGTVEFEGKY